MPTRLRTELLRAFGLSIHSSCRVSARCWFGGSGISLGRGTFLNYDCFLDNSAPVTIGEGCSLGMGVMIVTSEHEIGPGSRRAGRAKSAPVIIGDGTWVGARAFIGPGVTIGNGCIIGAGAVVLGDCDPNGLYAGVPARRVKDLN